MAEVPVDGTKCNVGELGGSWGRGGGRGVKRGAVSPPPFFFTLYEVIKYGFWGYGIP